MTAKSFTTRSTGRVDVKGRLHLATILALRGMLHGFAPLTRSMTPPIPGTILPGLARCPPTRRSLRPHRRNNLGQKRATVPQFFLDLVQLSGLSGYASHLWRAGSMKLLTGLLAAMLLLCGY